MLWNLSSNDKLQDLRILYSTYQAFFFSTHKHYPDILKDAWAWGRMSKIFKFCYEKNGKFQNCSFVLFLSIYDVCDEET